MVASSSTDQHGAERRLHRAERRLIERHFALRISPAGERKLRAHLPDCEPCRHYYQLQMALAESLASMPRMSERLAVGLGIRPLAPQRRERRYWIGATGAVVAACALLLVARRSVESPDQEFTARGAPAVAERPGLEVYRVSGDGGPGRPATWMSPGDELAFAYRNPTGFSRLMVFGVGDGQEIYWFHPAWTDGGDNPRAIPISAGSGPFELPEAIGHDVRGTQLRVVALFTREPLSVREVEQAVRAGGAELPGTVRVETIVTVRR